MTRITTGQTTALALATTIVAQLTGLATAQTRASPDVDTLLAAALDAHARGAQHELVQRARRLLQVAPDHAVGHLLGTVAHASLGPEFARDLARQGLQRLLAMPLERLEPAIRQQMLAIAGVRGGITALRTTLRHWQREVDRGQPLLAAADQVTLSRVTAQANQDLTELLAQRTQAQTRLSLAHKSVGKAERTFTQARRRKFALGEAMRDLQPFADALHAAQSNVAAEQRRLQDIDTRLPRLKQRVEQLRARLTRYGDMQRSG